MDEYFKILIAVGAGWLLKELSDALRVRRDQRKPVGECLSLLLGVHHLLFVSTVGIRVIDDAITSKGQQPDAAEKLRPHLRRALLSFATESGRPAEERFVDVVSSLSHVDPLLAFELRNQGSLWRMPDELNEWVEETLKDVGLSADYTASIREIAEQQVLPRLAASVRRVAWRHSKWVWVKVALGLWGKETATRRVVESLFEEIDVERLDSVPLSIVNEKRVKEVFGSRALTRSVAEDENEPEG